MSEVEHGPSAMESLRPQPSFTGLSGMEAPEKRSEEEREDGRSLHDVKRALKHNFRATGVIDDVTVREREREDVSTLLALFAVVALRKRNEPLLVCCEKARFKDLPCFFQNLGNNPPTRDPCLSQDHIRCGLELESRYWGAGPRLNEDHVLSLKSRNMFDSPERKRSAISVSWFRLTT